jgi:hypothetical protein
MSEVGFGLTGMAWNGGSWVYFDWNSLDWRKSVLASLKWVGFGIILKIVYNFEN